MAAAFQKSLGIYSKSRRIIVIKKDFCKWKGQLILEIIKELSH